MKNPLAHTLRTPKRFNLRLWTAGTLAYFTPLLGSQTPCSLRT